MHSDGSKFEWIILLRPLFVVLVLWIVFWADWTYYLSLYKFGILPRDLVGVRGVFFGPFIHGSLEHVAKNSISLAILMSIMGYFYPKQIYKVVLLGGLFSGILTWLFARLNYHIGASGVVYVLISYIFFTGLRTKYFRLVAVSLIVVVWYGGSVWYMFPLEDTSISWEGHLSGFIGGGILSLILDKPVFINKIKLYDWQSPEYDPSKDPFMRCFDADGNFIIISEVVVNDPYRKTLPTIYREVRRFRV